VEALPNIKSKVQDRIVNEFELPEEMKGMDEFVKQSIGLVKLKMSEEVAAAERATGNQIKLAYNWARYALVEVDGRKLKKEDGEDEKILEHCDPTIRELIVQAYAEISTAKAGDAKKFLKSRKEKI
jgi:hypothetical protein